MSTPTSSTNRRRLRLMIIIMTIGLMSYSFMEAFKHYEEDTKREQARYNLEHVVHCLNTTDAMLDSNVKGNHEIAPGLWDACTKNVRTSTTGDVYVLRLRDFKFIHDTSNDVPTNPLFFTEKSIGELFKDWPSGLSARNLMTSGTDSTSSSKVSYNFDGSPEWLEWKVWKHEKEQFVIVQGTQADEVYKGLAGITYLYYTFMLVIVMVLVMEVATIPLEVGEDTNGN